MKNVKHIVVLCTETPQTATVQEVVKNWRKKGLLNILYSQPFLVKGDGELERLKHYYYPDKKSPTEQIITPDEEGIYLVYIGGTDKDGNPSHNISQRQEEALFDKLVELSDKYPESAIIGIKELPGMENFSTCFDARAWLANYKPAFLEEKETELAA
jgi:N-acetylmuramoyl-L-alanine amidase